MSTMGVALSDSACAAVTTHDTEAAIDNSQMKNPALTKPIALSLTLLSMASHNSHLHEERG
jgi:hypothetical protein